jgi:hypothetical protein
MRKGLSYLKKKSYFNALLEFLKLKSSKNSWLALDMNLSQAYRGMIEKSIKGKDFELAAQLYQDLFKNSKAYDEADLFSYNDLKGKVKTLRKLRVRFEKAERPAFSVAKGSIKLCSFAEKPKGFKGIDRTPGSMLRAMKFSQIPPLTLPHLNLRSKQISYQDPKIKFARLTRDTFKMRPDPDNNGATTGRP